MRLAIGRHLAVAVTLLLVGATPLFAQTVTVTRNVNLRPEQSSAVPAIRLLTPDEPPMTLVEPLLLDGYYHVRTTMNEDGYVWARNVTVSTGTTPPPVGNPPPPPTTTADHDDHAGCRRAWLREHGGVWRRVMGARLQPDAALRAAGLRDDYRDDRRCDGHAVASPSRWHAART